MAAGDDPSQPLPDPVMRCFGLVDGCLQPLGQPGDEIPAATCWVDLLNPSPAHVALIKAKLDLDLPGYDSMFEIEESSRLSARAGMLVMTASVLVNSDAPYPQTTPVSFILASGRLLTVRYATPRAFDTFSNNPDRYDCGGSAYSLFLALFDAITDRVADILERVQTDMDRLAKNIFAHPDLEVREGRVERRFQVILRRIGRAQILTMKARESMVSLQRMLTFSVRASGPGGQSDYAATQKALERDIIALQDHAGYLSNTITFLLDATLGMLTAEQNTVIKVLSVATVLFLPPAVVAGIYGMNFQVMPELSWPWGYPLVLLVMLLSAVLPYFWFKRRGWL